MTQRTNRSKEEVAGIIKSILVAEKKSSTVGVPIVQLEDEYRSQDGMRIPYRALGYACLMDFLESLQRSGEIVIGKRGAMHVVYLCPDEKIAHVSALVSGQRDSSKRCSRGGKRFTTRAYPRVLYHPPKLDSKTLADVLKLIKSAANGIHVSRIIEYLHDRNNFNVDEDQLLRQLRDVSHEVTVANGMIFPVMRKQASPPNSPPKNFSSTNGFAGEKKSAPAYRPAGSSDGEEDNETFEFVKKSDRTQPPMSNNANPSYEESRAAPSNFDENANSARQDNTDSRVDDDHDDIGMLVNTRTRFRLEKLIQKHPNGIWCADLPEFYKQEYSIPLYYEELGFGNVSDFAAHLPEIFHCVRLQENGDFKLFDAKNPKPEARQNPRPEHLTLAALHNIYERYNEETEPVPVLLSPTTSQRLVPDGVMTVGETVAQICVTELFNDNTPHIDVIVVDTVTPTFFWIQLLKKTQKFDRFMRDLHAFYSENASKYVIPIVLLERGFNCACIFDKRWHRGVIKTVKPNNTVTVLFYDYGTVLTYPPEEIHFLHRTFSGLPAQAIPCGLYNVKPIATEKWPYSVCQVFAEKVLDVPMVAMLGSIDADNNSMLIALTNTEGTVDFHISDWMISSGFAMYGKMVCIRPPNYPFRHYLECKHGKIIRKEKQASNSNRIVSYDENSTASQPLLPAFDKTLENSSFYETLVKLRRRSSKNGLDVSSKSSSRESRAPGEESRFFNAETSQPLVKTTANRVTQENATRKTIVIQNGEKSCSQNKNYGTNLLTKLCATHANKMAALNVGSSESDLNESRTSNGASSSSASVNLADCKNTNSERNSVHRVQENAEISLVSKKFAKLAKFVASNGFKPIIPSTKSNETSSDEPIPEKPSPATPLHLRSEIPERRNCKSQFGAIYSALGGHGLMEPIDWNQLRNGEKSADNSNDALRKNSLPPSASTPLEKHAKSRLSSAYENFQKPICSSSFPYTQFDNLSDASIEFTTKARGTTIHSEKNAPAKLNQETEKPENESTRKCSFQEVENHEEKSLASCRDLPKSQEKYSIKRYLELAVAEEKASKPRAWNVPKAEKHSVKDYSEMANSLECTNHAEKMLSEPHKKPAYSEEKSSAPRHRGTSKSQTKNLGKSNQEMENSQGKSSAPRHRETSKSRTQDSEKSNQETANSEKTTSKLDNEGFSTISTSVVQNPSSTNATSKLATKKTAFLNLVRGRTETKEDLPEFGHFHSKFGGNGRLETIAWNEFRKLDSPEKIEVPKKVELKNVKKTPVKRREAVGKGFFNIINSVHPPPKQRDSLYVPEGNLMRQTELSPNLRNILKSVNEDVQDKQLRLFIPDDVAELLENDDSTSVSSSSTSSDANKCTVKYRSLCKPNASLESRSSSDTVPNSTQSDSSRAADDTHGDFDSTNDASGFMSGNASKSGEKLIKSTDTSATASQPSPAAAFSEDQRITSYVNAESNADEEKSRSPKAEKIGRDNVRKRVDFGAESPLIDLFPRAANDSHPDFDSTNDVSGIMSGYASRLEENLLKSTDTSATASQASPAAAFSDDKQITSYVNAESIADEEKSRSPKAEKIGRDNVRERVDFGADSPLIPGFSRAANDSHPDFDSTNDASGFMSGNASKSGEKLIKSTDTSASASQPSPAAAFSDDKQITSYVNAESIADEEKSRSPKAEKIGRDNVRKRVDFDADSRSFRHLKSSGTSPENCPPKLADFPEDKRDTKADSLPELTEGQEKRRMEKIETISSENVENRVDSVVERNSRRRFLSFDDSRESHSDDKKSTRERKIVETRVPLTDSVTDGSEKFPDPEEHKTPNAWIQSSSLKLTDSIFANFQKFFDSCIDSADDSDLDSDDLSSVEESVGNVKTQLEEITDDNHSEKLENFANEINESVDEKSRKSLDSNADQSSLHSDFSTEKIEAVVIGNEPRVSKKTDHRDSEKSVDFEDSGKTEKSICLPTNAEESSVQVAKEDEVIYYDDTCVVSDDDEWDFSPGSLLLRDIDDGHQTLNRNSYEKIDAPSDLKKMVTWKESNSDDDCVDDFSTDQQKNASSDVIENIHDDSTRKNEKNDSDKDSISKNESLENDPNFTHKNDADSDKDSISTNESIENDPNFTHKIDADSDKDLISANESLENDPNFTHKIDADSDKDSILTNESLENDPNYANNNSDSTDCKKTSHSILSEVQKLNISATANAFAHINSSSSSSSSSSSKNESYTKSFMSALKHYL